MHYSLKTKRSAFENYQVKTLTVRFGIKSNETNPSK